MESSCICGKKFKTERGMKIHRTKMGCVKAFQELQQRTANTVDKTSENSSQDTNHSAEYVHVVTTDEAFIQSIEERRRKLKLPQANEEQSWETLDIAIVGKLKSLLGKSTLDLRLETFGDIIYETCRELCGVVETKQKRQRQRSRRQREMDSLRGKKRVLKKRMKTASEEEKEGLQVLWRELKTKHSALSKAEALRRRRSKKKKTQDDFFRNPFNFARKLFEQPRSGTLAVDKVTLERHLKDTYSDENRLVEMDEIQDLVWPESPEKEFSNRPPSWEEVTRVVRKARAKSAPGPNGIPYLLYKKCPNVLGWVHRLICSAWKNKKVPKQWMCADGVYIPKEQNSTQINQFRPISLLNVEGKIFFSVMASRMTKYLTDNGFVDTTIQKGGMPGMPGCLEHATMIWDAIQKAKSSKQNLDVVWLDLANAYGSVPHQMIQLALRMHHVPESIRSILETYFSGFQMRFSSNDFTTSWINLEVGIAMGCAISPILFVLTMEVILKAAQNEANTLDSRDWYKLPPLKAFMDDTTVLSSSEDRTHEMLGKLDRLIRWCRMSFKPKKSRSLSVRRGKVVNREFTIAEQVIPTVAQEPVKSLGRWYDATLKDTKRGAETLQVTEEGLRIIEQCGLQGKYKLWCLQFMLIPKLLWPLLVYEISTTTVEAIEAKINKFSRKWLGVPPCASDVALYCRQAKLKLPLKSVVEEYKVGKVRLRMMLEDSADETIRSSQPTLKTGRKWKVDNAVNEAKSALRMKEIIGHTQSNRRGLGGTDIKWWSQTIGKERRDMVIQEVRQEEDRKRVVKAVQQSQQGQWTAWDNAIQRSLTWNDLWKMAPLRISFILRSTYDLLPTNANLTKWNMTEDASCPLCEQTQTVDHVLSSCKVALAQGRYTWRHNRVLEELAAVVDSAHGNQKGPEMITTEFVTQGNKKKWIGKATPLQTRKKGILDGYDDWEIAVDLPSWGNYPEAIKESRLRPDITLFSESSKQMILIELTVPYESRIEYAHTYKTEKYSDLAKDLERKGFKTKVFAVEVGARGYIGTSVYDLLKQLNISGKSLRKAMKILAETAEKSSHWIWIHRNERETSNIRN